MKAAGVTFAASMIERVIEEQAGGDASRAEAVRRSVSPVSGAGLGSVRPDRPCPILSYLTMACYRRTDITRIDKEILLYDSADVPDS